MTTYNVHVVHIVHTELNLLALEEVKFPCSTSNVRLLLT